MEGLVFIVVLGLRAGIGALLGKGRKVGSGWGAMLGAFLGLIGYIIIICSKRNTSPSFIDVKE